MQPNSEELPALPLPSFRNASSRERSAKDFQRPCSPVEIDMERLMETKPTNHNQHDRQYPNNGIPKPLRRTENKKKQPVEEHRTEFRKDYFLGETVRSPSHMITEPTSERAVRSIDSLRQYDFVFVKRSDGSYSYAILAYRSMELIKGRNKREECMTFAMTDTGATKMVRRRSWHRVVRLVSMERSFDEANT